MVVSLISASRDIAPAELEPDAFMFRLAELVQPVAISTVIVPRHGGEY